MRRTAVILALAALVAGCATAGGWPTSHREAERGRQFVQRACAGCHAIGPSSASPNPLSPPFRTLAARLPGPALQAELGLIARRGHVQMPPIYLTPKEIRAVTAYIRSVSEAKRGLGENT